MGIDRDFYLVTYNREIARIGAMPIRNACAGRIGRIVHIKSNVFPR